MSLFTMSNISNQKSSLCPTNGRQTVGDGAFTFDNEPSVLAGPGGAFDAPKVKCPPDRGSSNCVTGSSASFSSYPLSDSPPSSISSSPCTNRFGSSNAAQSAAIDMITSLSYASSISVPSRNSSISSTPPLTPDDSSVYTQSSRGSTAQHDDALDFLMTVFPRQGLSALPYAKKVSISAPNLGADFEGVVLELPGTLKTLYVDGKSAHSVNLRESIVALLDLADESLGCHSLIIVLERSSPNLGNVLHSLMYVGGAVVTKPLYDVDPAFVLVGLEI
ncbi:hypothetical protein D9613_000650 [Agrocybe pediades]|uniref:Ornithine decarboxylase antizyme n=1 Tax=Agrocybe pediades TaxID=84607 RepID=A0A8H4R0Y4_9AGAR|nr:hypothetical protein D9613_000650 [Agrocybe pediades]